MSQTDFDTDDFMSSSSSGDSSESAYESVVPNCGD